MRIALFLLLAFMLSAQEPKSAPDQKDAEIASLKIKVEIYRRMAYACQDQQIDAAAKAVK